MLGSGSVETSSGVGASVGAKVGVAWDSLVVAGASATGGVEGSPVIVALGRGCGVAEAVASTTATTVVGVACSLVPAPQPARNSAVNKAKYIIFNLLFLSKLPLDHFPVVVLVLNISLQ